MAEQKFTLTFDAQLNVNQMKSALSQIQSTFNGLHLPQNITKGLQGTFDKLSREVQDFEAAISRDITGKADFKKLDTQANKIIIDFEKLKIQIRDLVGLNNDDLEKLFPASVTKNISDASNALKQYQINLGNAEKDVRNAQTAVQRLNDSIAREQGKTVLTGDQYKQLTTDLKNAEQEITDLENKLQELNDKQQRMLSSGFRYPLRSSTYRKVVQDIQDVNNQLVQARQNAQNLANQKADSTTFEKQARNLAELNNKLLQATTKLSQFQTVFNTMSSAGTGGGLKQLLDDIGNLTGLDMSQFTQDIMGASNAIHTYLNQQLQQLTANLQGAQTSVNGMLPSITGLRDGMRSSGEAVEEFDTRLNDVKAFKTRLLQFFSLNNAVQLLRRTMRDAFNTIKELDKAMTETAVVTGFSVGDMWAQLPQYTKRANELGVTTKEAYEAATLYYQQGLKTNEVMAISNETLKMARIAGLGAAEATDRMTNAIRGFNMEINETNAQRIDDVYSRLAAISASNVDEISTAMTKVASLANNANMQFETTAAFLAQIIETTRESAETAGTALKTVIARFSEVKELYSEGELRGEDEEGEAIDVNRISKALRTAGIDLNKYFLGEVGLDDIFIELASKWDSLTAVQQRYIATQAAGSRQQSRFIALMSDYARTQELVGEAYKANGAAATQFAKTQESLQSKLAKLKNAWNQFAMGILNSDLVKLGVDLLTGLLNTVNALTSGFGALNGGIGGVINTILKLGLVIGALNLGKGLVAGVSGSLLGKGSFGSLMSKAMFGNKGPILTGLAGNGGLGTAVAGFLNPLAMIGGKLWGGFKGIGRSIMSSPGKIGDIGSGIGALLGKLGIGPGLASGLTGLVPVLGAIAAGATAIWGAYKIWERYTPEGQLKVAKKIAEKQQEIAQEAKATADGYKQVQEEYQKYSDAVDSSTTKAERDTAIKEQNEYIMSLIEKDRTYAEYLESAKTQDGQIMLTLDAEKLAKAAETAAKTAAEAASKSYIANARVYQRQANVYRAKLDKSEEAKAAQANPTHWQQDNPYAGRDILSPEDEARYELLEQAALEKEIPEIRSTISTLLQSSVDKDLLSFDLSNNIADSISNLLAKTNSDIYNNVFKANGEINQEGFDTFTLYIDDIAKAIAGSPYMQKLLSIMSGDIDANLQGIGDEGLLEALGIDADSDEFKEFAKLIDIGDKELKEFIKTLASGTRQIQYQNRERLVNRLGEKGVSADSLETAWNLAPEMQAAMLGALDAAEGLLSEDQYGSFVEKLLNPETTKEDIEEIDTLLSQINLDDPLAAFIKLQKGINGTNTTAQELYRWVMDSNPQLLNSATLIKDNLLVAYEEVSDKVQELIKENKNLTPENIEELSNESKVLKQLLDSGIVSAKALAIAFTQVGNGSTEIDSINQSVLNVLDNVHTFKDLVDDVHNQIANFDEGIDYGEGVDFFSSKLNELSELVDNYEFGNERTERLWNLIFGTDYKTAWGIGEDYVREQVQQMSQWLEDDAYNFFKENADLLNITDLGEGILDWDLDEYLKDEQGIHTLDTLVNKFAEDLGITTDAAKMFIETFRSHGNINFAKYIDDLSINSIYDQIFNGTNVHGKPQKIWSDEDLNIIAQAYNIGLDELKDKLKNYQQNNEGFDDFVFGGPLFGENLYKQFKERATIADIALDQFIENGQLKIEELRNVLSQLGYVTAEAQNDIISSMYADKNYAPQLTEENTVSLSIRFKVASILGVNFGSDAEQDLSSKLTDALTSTTPSASITKLALGMAENGEIDSTSMANLLQFISGEFAGKPLILNDLMALPWFKELDENAKKVVLAMYALQYMGMPITFSDLNALLVNLGVGKKTRVDVLKGMASQISGSPIPFNKIEAYINSGGITLAEGTDSDDIMAAIVTCLTTGEGGSNTLDFPKLYAILRDLGVKNVFNALSYIGSALTGVGIPMTLSGLDTLITNPDLSNMTPQEKKDYFDAIKEVLLTYYSIPGNQMNLGTLAILCGLGSTIDTTDAEFYYGTISSFLLGYYTSGEHEVYFDLGTLEYLCEIGDKLEEGDREKFYGGIKEPLLTYYSDHAADGSFNLGDLEYLCKIGNGLEPGFQEQYFKSIMGALIIYYRFHQRLGEFNIGDLKYAATVASNLPENEVPGFYNDILTDLKDYYGNEANASKFKLGDLEYLTNLVSSAQQAGASSELISGFYDTIFGLLTTYYSDETNASNFNLGDLQYLVDLTSDAEEAGSTKASGFFDTLTRLLKDYYKINGLNLGDIEPTLKPILGEEAYNQFIKDVQGSLPDSINKDIVVKFNTVTAEEAVEKILRTNLDPTGVFSSSASLLNTINELTTFITSVMPAEELPSLEYYSQIYDKLIAPRDKSGYGLDTETAMQILESVQGIYGQQLSDEILGISQEAITNYAKESGIAIEDIITTTAEDGSVIISTEAGDTDLSGLGKNLEEQFKESALDGYTFIETTFNNKGLTVQIRLIPTIGPLNLGLASSEAKGGFNSSPTTALTGEEGPEIVWNKEQGYSYITGSNGPEFRGLNASDQVFNAEETKRILRNSKNNQLFGSHADGINTPKVLPIDAIQDDLAPVSVSQITDAINESEIGQWNIGDEGNNGSGSDDSGSKWKNELDWLYNLLEDIAELERQQNLIQERHDQLLNDLNTNGRRLFELTEKELNNLKEQLANQQLLQNKREEELNVWLKYARDSGFGNYVWWNNKDQTLEIDWDKINAITDKDRYDQLKEIIDRLEQLQDQIDETESSIIDIEGQIQELENRYLQEFADFQQRVYDAIVDQYQEEIDHLSELNDTLNDTNTSILESLQREIDLQRQIRDNTDTERNIRDMEARLAYLRRDTTGANENAIRELERELEDAREGYTDTLIDQSIERLQQSNDDASEQRQQQIDLLTAQLDEWKEDGELWSEVQRLIEEGFDHDGGFLRGSELESILQRADSWRSMSEAQREVWANELIQQTNQVGAYLIKIAEGLHDLGPTVWSDLPDHYYRPPERETTKGFVTSGLTHRTGAAWLDGTLNEPEYVLNAKQADAFLRLADVLPAIFGTGGVSTTNLGGNMYVELNMNVGGISSDYDVDRLVERVKSDIMAAGAYRNVKAVNFLR